MADFKRKLLLIDGHALFHRAFHALTGMTGPGGFPTGAVFGFLSMLFKAFVDIKPTHALVTFDMPGATFRDALAADYKGKRKATPDDLIVQLPKLKAILTALDIPIYEKVGFEADDLLGIIAHKTPKNVLNIIVTGDLDLLQLINDRTHVYRFKTGFSDIQIFDTDKMVEIYGLHPSQWVDYKAIRGDASDNIPGVPGIGEKGGLELVKMFDSLDGIYEAVEKKDPRIKSGTLKKLEEGKAKAYLSYKLAHIDPKNHLDFDFEKTSLGDYDQKKVLELLHALGIKALDSRLPKVSKDVQQAVELETKSASSELSKPNDIIHNEQQALIAAYLIDPGRRSYETSDWNYLSSQLKAKKLLKIFQEIEVPLMSVLILMQSRGIKLDLPWLKALSKQLGQRVDELTKQIYKQAGKEFNIASPIQLREVLFDDLKLFAERLKKTGKTKALSTNAQQLEKLRGTHPIIDLIFEYREVTKLKSTYVDPLPQLVSKKDNRLHTTYSQTVSAHGRLSSINPNLQNIPIRTQLGNEVRKAFIAEKGKVLLSLDYSQIELRIAASLSGDPEMIKIFTTEGDFHTATAARIFNVSEAKVTPAQRRAAKTINFSILYGVSAFGLSERSDMQQAEASEYIKKYYEVFSQLKAYISGLIQMAHKDGFMTNPLGRIRYFPDIHASNFAIRAGAERQVVNMPIQSLAADIIKMAMIEIEKELPEANMLLTVHDELVFEIEDGKTEEYIPKIKKIMESVYELKVPLVVDAKFGSNWQEMVKHQ
jgi:DNA polymerase-1